MESKNRYSGIEKYAVRIIRYKAKKLVGHYGFTTSDQEDFEQEMMFDVLRRLPKFNPDKKTKRNTFIAKVVEHKVVNLIEAQKAGVRDYRLCGHSINECVEDENGKQTEYVDNINQDDYFRGTGKCLCSQEELIELSINVRQVIDGLDVKYRDLCKRLQEDNVSEISRSTGVSRGAIYDSIKKLQIVFADAGFRNYS